MWQGALRNPDDPVRADVVDAIETLEPITVELLYSDQIGRQRTISRFGLIPGGDTWFAGLNRHWYLDWEGPPPGEPHARGGRGALPAYRPVASSARTTEPNVHVSMHPALLGFVLLGYAAVPSELLVQGVAIRLPRYR